ncbi:hypothetical protein ACJRO7_008231 [Eucalyptus globulus]|uniref:D-aminoacyl-tRNA deacylase n=1 Tax=Eucalyptus globulus TaxID=34317 RepID=A0ABD3IR58_EUCGL
MVTLVAATTVDPASIGLGLPFWPCPGMLSFANEEVRLLKLENHLAREDHLDKRWEGATGESVDGAIFLSRHVAASNRPALTIHPIGPPHLREDEVLLAGGRPGWAGPPKALEQHCRVTLEATHHGPEISSPAMFIEIGSTEEYWERQDAAQAIALLVWEGLGLGGGNSVGDWSRKDDRPKVLLGIGGGHYVPRHMDIVRLQSKGVAGMWRKVINIAFETSRLAFPGGEVLAHLDLESFKTWRRKAVTEFLESEEIKIGKPGDFY